MHACVSPSASAHEPEKGESACAHQLIHAERSSNGSGSSSECEIERLEDRLQSYSEKIQNKSHPGHAFGPLVHTAWCFSPALK